MLKSKLLKALFSFIILASFFIMSSFYRNNSIGVESGLNEDSQKNQKIQSILEKIEDQTRIDEELLAELESNRYSFDDPLIVVNPYGNSPLTALILFTTELPSSVSISVLGDGEMASFSYDYNTYETQHVIPVYALYPGESTEVQLTLSDNNTVLSSSFFIEADPLIEELTDNILNVIEKGLTYQPGLNFSYQNGHSNTYKTAFDYNGDYRWYLHEKVGFIANYQSESFWSFYSLENNESLITEFDYLGRILSLYFYPYDIHHDIDLVENRLLLTSSDNKPETVEDFITELDLDTGKITQSLNYRSILFRNRIFGFRYSHTDWMHMNSIVEIENDVIVSSNWQSTVIRNSWDGDIKWILGNPTGFPQPYLKYFLTPIGETFEYSYNQHAVEILDDLDNNPNTIDIILFDNGSSRNVVDQELQRQIAANEVVEPDLYSRLVHYRINEVDLTVEQIWSYGEERKELFSPYRGDADVLANSNVLGTFYIQQVFEDDTIRNTTYIEIDLDGNVIWECWASSANKTSQYVDYRSERLNLYNDYSMQFKFNVEPKIFLESSN